ncbi:MAG TPA: FlgD immunoglobulin-like domain containing protein [Alphaproteobacteria bacterium]
MTISPVGQSSSATASAISNFSQNFDSFLLLLTTQLKNQDPLSPVSSTEFTTQLVQFAGVEQNIRQTQQLEQLVAMQQAWQASSAVNFIGRTVEVTGASIVLKDAKGAFSYTLDEPATEVTITIKNASGEVVRTLEGETAKGTHDIEWDGTSDDGYTLPDGIYSFTVSAKNTAGKAIEAKTTFTGVVSAVEATGGSIVFQIGDRKAPISDIKSVRETTTPGGTSEAPQA